MLFSLSLPLKRSKRVWSREEDIHLVALVEEFGAHGNWPRIALRLDRRTKKECKSRYMNYFDPFLRTATWTHDEDAIIKRMHTLLGARWSTIKKHLPGRSEKDIKNRQKNICRDNYSDHDVHGIVKTAFRMDASARTFNAQSLAAPESLAVRLERFRLARDLMDEKIAMLLVEPEGLSRSQSQSSNKLVTKRSVDSGSGMRITVHATDATRLVTKRSVESAKSHISGKSGKSQSSVYPYSESDSDSDGTCDTSMSRSQEGAGGGGGDGVEKEDYEEEEMSMSSITSMTRSFRSMTGQRSAEKQDTQAAW